MNTNKLLRYIPLLIIISGLCTVYWLDIHHLISLKFLQENNEQLLAYKNENYLSFLLIFATMYVSVVALSIPAALFFTIASGYFYGVIAGGAVAVFSATIGAILVFYAINLIARDRVLKVIATKLPGFKKGVESDAFFYILFLRLVPIFPFSLVNIGSAVLNVNIFKFIGATLLGIIPGALIYASVGNALNSIAISRGSVDLGVIFDPEIFIPLVLLGCLSIFSIFAKKALKKFGL